MVVVITNLTDGPGKRPREVRIFSKRLLPGKSIRVPAQYVDAKMRALEETGHISIGAVPSWYSDHKSRRVLSAEEVVESRKRASDRAEAKAKANKKLFGAPAKPEPVSAKVEAPPKVQFDLSDEVEDLDDSTSLDTKPGKRNKRR